MFTRLLVPLDGTPESNAALPLARTQAHARGASIVLFQVADVFLATDEPLVAKGVRAVGSLPWLPATSTPRSYVWRDT